MNHDRGESAVSRSTETASLAVAPAFASTHWSVIKRAQGRNSQSKREALAILCRTYWPPIYVFIRRQSDSADIAEELTQEFFALFLEKGIVKDADPTKGKFRHFLLGCCRHFLANQKKQERALRHGGGTNILSLDVAAARQRYLLEPADHLTPEKQFDRRWALTLLEQSLDQLRREYEQQAKKDLFDLLIHHLLADPRAMTHAETARHLGMTEAAVKKNAQRMRRRLRDIMREQILLTVECPEQVEDEIRELFVVLRD